MTFEPLVIPEVVLIKPEVHSDDRGFLRETYKASAFREAGLPEHFEQSNHSRSQRGVLRGLHYQTPPASHGKLVSVVRGEVLDVAVDIRRNSPTYGTWVSARLSDDNHHQLYVPPGFAHGFYVLSEVADVFYCLSAEYSKEHDRGILWNDPDIGIDWGTDAPLLSKRDKKLPTLEEADNPF